MRATARRHKLPLLMLPINSLMRRVTRRQFGFTFAPTKHEVIELADGNSQDQSKGQPDAQTPVDIAPRLVNSQGFTALYSEGMSLIEEVAAYLDGDGRVESRTLSRESAFVYATESMRLTTRLMQLASWLLLQRAVNDGEITAENARTEKSKVKFTATPAERGGPGWDDLPERFLSYVAQGDRLFARVMRIDAMDRGEKPTDDAPSPENNIADQLSRLQAAFGSRG